jgi:hypothetical protein
MPQRFLKPGIRNSERWNSVSWSAQSLYIRLLTVVDDYGRFDGRSAVIHGECFSLYNAINPDNPVKLQETDKMLQEIAASFLIELYDAKGKRVMQITQWTERIRDGVKEKWPSKNNGELLQLPADSCKNLPSPSPSPSSIPPSITITSGYRPSLSECEEIYALYPKKKDRANALKAITKALKKEGGSTMISEKTRLMGEAWRLEPSKQYCPHAATWFNGERYLDPPESYQPHSPFKPNQRNEGMGMNTSEQGKKAQAMVAKMNGKQSQPELLGGAA